MHILNMQGYMRRKLYHICRLSFANGKYTVSECYLQLFVPQLYLTTVK